MAQTNQLKEAIWSQLKNLPEQREVVGPLVLRLCQSGWDLDQIRFGRQEWSVPSTPSEATKREKRRSFKGFPVDITVFDRAKHVGDPRHVLFLIECKQPTEPAGVSQTERYLASEPYARLGIWSNSSDSSASAAFLFKKPSGSILLKRRRLSELPAPGEAIRPEAQRITFKDLIAPTEGILRSTIEDLLDKVVARDSKVTRREDQLDQLCNLLLLKLESDKEAKSKQTHAVMFRTLESHDRTAEAIRERYSQFVDLYPDTFITDQDKSIRLANDTVAACVEALSGLRLIDLAVSTVAVAFQVLRSEALKQGEGQYFTPAQVIQAGVRLLDVQWQDIVIDPACGTGGFLVESILEIKRKHPEISEAELSKWAQTHIYGIEKDAIGLKLTKAIMQIAGDGSAHCARGDSIRTHLWEHDYPHLNSNMFKDRRFSVVLTNPPFGKKLTVSEHDSRFSGMDIAKGADGNFRELEIGLVFLQRSYQLLRRGGRLGIVLPETYFFSKNYQFLLDWIRPRLRMKVVANIPMEAFQGFCRAKTNFYVFEKISDK